MSGFCSIFGQPVSRLIGSPLVRWGGDGFGLAGGDVAASDGVAASERG